MIHVPEFFAIQERLVPERGPVGRLDHDGGHEADEIVQVVHPLWTELPVSVRATLDAALERRHAAAPKTVHVSQSLVEQRHRVQGVRPPARGERIVYQVPRVRLQLHERQPVGGGG